MYTYICKSCGHETPIDEKELLSGSKIICRRCLRISGVNDRMAAAAGPERRNSLLSPEQEQAAYYHGGAPAVLVVGGAGTGKTKVLTERVLYLNKEAHVPVESIAVLTFSRRAATELNRRLKAGGMRAVRVPVLWSSPGEFRHRRPSNIPPNTLFAGSFYSFCLNLMKDFCGCYENSAWYPETEDFSLDIDELNLIDRNDQCAIIGKLRGELGISGKTLSSLVPEAEELRGILSFVSNSMIDVEEYYRRCPAASPETQEYVKTLAGMYAAYKRKHGEMDMDDLLAITARTLKISSFFREAFQKQYFHVLVDEVQDATPVEWSILQSICPTARLFCTGNDAQSICSSDGANFNAIRDFGTMFPGAITLKLTENFRSMQEILELSNVLLKESELAYETPVTSHRGESGHKPELRTFPTEQEEVDFVLESVRSKLTEGVPPGEITLLFHSAGQAQVMEQALRAAGIPYRFIGGANFLQKPHVKDVFSVLDITNDFRNKPAWRRILALYPKLDPRTVSSFIRNIPSNEATEKKNNSYDVERDARMEVFNMVYRFLPNLSSFLFNCPSSFFGLDSQMKKIVEFFNQTGLLKKKYDDWAERKNDLRTLIHVADRDRYYEPASRGGFEIRERFDKEFKLDSDAIVQEYDRDAAKKLTLATVHSAKGIESDYCYLFRVQDGVFPQGKAASPEAIEEERRVLYVAMTRARKQLVLTQTAGGSSIFLTQAMKQKMDAGQSERNDNNGKQSNVR